MSARVKIKVKKLDKEQKDDINEINKIFSQMTGDVDCDAEIILPNYVNLKMALHEFCRIFEIISDAKSRFLLKGIPGIDSALDKLTINIKNMRETHKISSDESSEKYSSLSIQEINLAMKTLCKSEDVKNIIVVCGGMLPWKKFIENKTKLDDSFINSEIATLYIFGSIFPIDIKVVWENATSPQKSIFLSVIHNVFTTGLKVHDKATTPNIDIKKFSTILVSKIALLRKEIPRCDKAFDHIEKSAGLLEKKFKTYYRDSLEAGNTSIIAESFLTDMLKSDKMSTDVKFQLTKIIAYLKRKASESKNPHVKKITKIIGKGMNQFPLNGDAPDETAPGETPGSRSGETAPEEVPGPQPGETPDSRPDGTPGETLEPPEEEIPDSETLD